MIVQEGFEARKRGLSSCKASFGTRSLCLTKRIGGRESRASFACNVQCDIFEEAQTLETLLTGLTAFDALIIRIGFRLWRFSERALLIEILEAMMRRAWVQTAHYVGHI